MYDDTAAAAPLAGLDGETAMRIVRARADEFGVDPNRVGFMGFSAGGNVAVRVAYTSDPAARPNFVAPISAATRGIEVGEQWRAAKLPVELHAYARGGHGFGMRVQQLPSDSWIDRFLDWCAASI